ncbi:ribosomal-processing cysteine protease Prp [Streptococcus orisasini]
MIQVTFIRRKGLLESAELTGHAGSGEYGFDIVCAAVSTLSINLVNALEVLADCTVHLQMDEIDGGYMKIDLSHIANKSNEKVQLLFEAFLLGITNLAENSPEFVAVKVITQ